MDCYHLRRRLTLIFLLSFSFIFLCPHLFFFGFHPHMLIYLTRLIPQDTCTTHTHMASKLGDENTTQNLVEQTQVFCQQPNTLVSNSQYFQNTIAIFAMALRARLRTKSLMILTQFFSGNRKNHNWQTKSSRIFRFNTPSASPNRIQGILSAKDLHIDTKSDTNTH